MTTAVEIKDFIKMAREYMPEVVTLGVVTANQLKAENLDSEIKTSVKSTQEFQSLVSNFYDGLIPSNIAVVTKEDLMRMETETRLSQNLESSTPSIKKSGLKIK